MYAKIVQLLLGVILFLFVVKCAGRCITPFIFEQSFVFFCILKRANYLVIFDVARKKFSYRLLVWFIIRKETVYTCIAFVANSRPPNSSSSIVWPLPSCRII